MKKKHISLSFKYFIILQNKKISVFHSWIISNLSIFHFWVLLWIITFFMFSIPQFSKMFYITQFHFFSFFQPKKEKEQKKTNKKKIKHFFLFLPSFIKIFFKKKILPNNPVIFHIFPLIFTPLLFVLFLIQKEKKKSE